MWGQRHYWMTLSINVFPLYYKQKLYLIHILAKQDTPMKARRTLLGCVPAKLRTRVIKTRSMLVLLKADEIVKPPMSNMIVGENIAEKTNLQAIFKFGPLVTEL